LEDQRKTPGPDKDAPELAGIAMERINEMLQAAFREGYSRGFGKGFEQGAHAGLGLAPKVVKLV
jgi:flagellar biosynthesis/type III secretory pathway protein FliH